MAKHDLVGFQNSVSDSAQLQKETPMRRVLKVLVVVGVGLGLGGTAPAQGASHGGHHGGGHAGAAHRSPNSGYPRGGAGHGYQHGGSGGHHNGHPGYQRNYHLTYGRQFRHGYYYPGRYHRHWAYTRFDYRYGCTLYYDPDLCCYYYWCEPDRCYYPVSYCPYKRYAWSTAGDEHDGEDAGQVQKDLDAFETRMP